jgi:hypothetical protein
MSMLWRSKAIIVNRLIYRRTVTTGLVARNNIDIMVLIMIMITVLTTIGIMNQWLGIMT